MVEKFHGFQFLVSPTFNESFLVRIGRPVIKDGGWGAKSLQPKKPPLENSSLQIPPQKNPSSKIPPQENTSQQNISRQNTYQQNTSKNKKPTHEL